MPSRSRQVAVKANPKLWERVKREVIRGSKGGPPGKSSARKMQLAVQIYKSRGGKYKGKKSSTNALSKWSREKWGYVSKKGSKTRSGRYLPQVVRKHMSSRAKREENRRKGSRRGQWVPYGKETTRLMHKYGVIRGSRSRKGSKRRTVSSRKTKHSSRK